LLWWIKTTPLPPSLITTGPVSDIPGALGHGGVALSNNGLSFDPLSGVRLSAGGWLDGDQVLAIDVGGFLLAKHTRSIALQSDATGTPVLAFRYLDPPVGGVAAEDAFQASVPATLSAGPPQLGPYAGGLGLSASTRLWGTEANLMANLGNCPACADDHSRLYWQMLGGFRYLDLGEGLDLVFNRQAIPGSGSNVVFQGVPFPDPSAVSSQDSFQTRNQFYGGQVGVRAGYVSGRFGLEFSGKVALGASHEVVNVFGTSTLTPNEGSSVTVAGGQFAGPSNIGRTTRDEFAVVPEVGLRAAYQLNDYLSASIGYHFLYWSRVVRPGRQVDLIVDTRGNPVDPGFTGEQVMFPRPLFNHSDFWAQGLTFGLEVSY
jgi:hypothetical protein